MSRRPAHEGSWTVHAEMPTLHAGSATTHEGSCMVHDRSSAIHEGSWMVYPGSVTTHEGSWMVYLGSVTVHEGSWIVHAGSWVAHEGSWIVHEGSWVAHEGSWKVHAGSWTAYGSAWTAPVAWPMAPLLPLCRATGRGGAYRVPGTYFRDLPEYRLTGAIGPDHSKVFTVECLVGGEVAGRGEGPSKKMAEQKAAAEALAQIPSLEKK